jgi:hypothetical protein
MQDAQKGGNPIRPRRAFLACLALHAPRSLAGFFSILLESPAPNRPMRGMYLPL